MASLLFQRSVQLGAVLVDLRHGIGRAQAPDESRRVPGGAAGQLVLLQQQDVLPAQLGEVIGDAAADDTAADDNDFGLRGNGCRHAKTLPALAESTQDGNGPTQSGKDDFHVVPVVVSALCAEPVEPQARRYRIVLSMYLMAVQQRRPISFVFYSSSVP